MSYDVDICVGDTDEVREFNGAYDIKGGTYAIGGTTEAHLNVTYNYYDQFHKVWGHGLRDFNGMKVRDIIGKLYQAVEELGVERDDDYWASTPGNAGAAISDLLFLINRECDLDDTVRVS